MKVEIDQNSGYCFGVEFAIQMAEDELWMVKYFIVWAILFTMTWK